LAVPRLFSGVRAEEVDLSVLSGNMKRALTSFQTMMDDLPSSPSGYFIDEIELNMGISGSGGVALIGKLEVGMEAAVKVKIKRKP